MRLIDADALIEEIESRYGGNTWIKGFVIVHIIKAMPTVEEDSDGAWIETEDGAVNLDTMVALNVGPYDRGVAIWAWNVTGGQNPIYTTDPNHKKQLVKVTHQIAQIARGNAYISQDDIRRMMDEEG